MPKKLALVIGNSDYQDTALAKLKAPDADVRALTELLRDPEIGQFDEVLALVNEPEAKTRRSIASFFVRARPDDMLLLYFSGHGLLDDKGRLYLAAQDTQRDLPQATAISAAFISEAMDSSRSRQQLLILDCCHSGAFARGARSVAEAKAITQATFEGMGSGRAVLTATDATQYAWEGETVIGTAENSVFTHFVIEGLKTGAADTDNDGEITLEELYTYLYSEVVKQTPKQTPRKWSYNQQGEFLIARNPNPGTARPLPLPDDLQHSLEDLRPWVREGSLRELERLLLGSVPGLAVAAYSALLKLKDDDSRRVAVAAADTVAKFEAVRAAQQQQAEAARQARLAERAAREQAEADRLAAEKAARQAAEQAEAVRLAAEKAERAQAEAQRLAAEKAARDRADAERLAAELAELARIKAEADRMAAEEAERARAKAEADRAAAVKAEQARAKAEADRLAAEKAEADRIAAEKAEADRKAAEEIEQARARAAAEKLAAEKARQEQAAAEKAEADRLAVKEMEAARARAEVERVAAEKARQERAQAEAERRTAEMARKAREKAEADRVGAEKAEAERLAAARVEAARIAAEKSAADKAAADKAAAEKAVRAKAAADKAARDLAEANRMAAEKAARERAEARRLAAAKADADRLAAARATRADITTPIPAPDPSASLPPSLRPPHVAPLASKLTQASWFPAVLIGVGWAASRWLAQLVLAPDNPFNLGWFLNWVVGAAAGGLITGMALRRLDPALPPGIVRRVAAGWVGAWALGWLVVRGLVEISNETGLSPEYALLDLIAAVVFGAVGGRLMGAAWRAAQPRLGDGHVRQLAAGWAASWAAGAIVLGLMRDDSGMVTAWTAGGLIAGLLGGGLVWRVARQVRAAPAPAPQAAGPLPAAGPLAMAAPLAVMAAGWGLGSFLTQLFYFLGKELSELPLFNVINVIGWILGGIVGGWATGLALRLASPAAGWKQLPSAAAAWGASLGVGWMAAIAVRTFGSELKTHLPDGLPIAVGLAVAGWLGGRLMAAAWQRQFASLGQRPAAGAAAGWAAAMGVASVVFWNFLNETGASRETWVVGWALAGALAGVTGGAVMLWQFTRRGS